MIPIILYKIINHLILSNSLFYHTNLKPYFKNLIAQNSFE